MSFALPLVLVMAGSLQAIQPVALISAGLFPSLLGFCLTIDYQPSVLTITIIWATYLMFCLGCAVSVTLQRVRRNGLSISRGLYRSEQWAIVCALFIALFVFGSIIASANSVAQYFANAMALRTQVANPDYDAGFSISRPAIPHILSISALYVASSLIAGRLALGKTHRNTKRTILGVLITALLISINDISRGRFLDTFIILSLGVLAVSGKKSIVSFAYGVIGMIILMSIASVLQGKATIFSVFDHFGQYFGLPVAYFDRDFHGEMLPNNYGTQTFHAFYNIASTLGFYPEYIRIENRGESLSGYTAVLIYPGVKTLLDDFGYLLGFFLVLIFGFISQSAYQWQKTRGQIEKAIYFCFAVGIVNFYATWRYGDNYFVVAMIILASLLLIPKRYTKS